MFGAPVRNLSGVNVTYRQDRAASIKAFPKPGISTDAGHRLARAALGQWVDAYAHGDMKLAGFYGRVFARGSGARSMHASIVQ